jgi:hypothetical protein
VYRKELLEAVSAIFKMKATMNLPNQDTPEQKVCFVSVESTSARTRQNKISFQASGSIVVFGRLEDLPAGYFIRMIRLASHELNSKFFFSGETMDPVTVDVIGRSIEFQFLTEMDFNPEEPMVAVDWE